jgi:hypothetical protein
MGRPAGSGKRATRVYDSLGIKAKGQPMPIGIAVQMRGESGIQLNGAPRTGITVNTAVLGGIR